MKKGKNKIDRKQMYGLTSNLDAYLKTKLCLKLASSTLSLQNTGLQLYDPFTVEEFPHPPPHKHFSSALTIPLKSQNSIKRNKSLLEKPQNESRKIRLFRVNSRLLSSPYVSGMSQQCLEDLFRSTDKTQQRTRSCYRTSHKSSFRKLTPTEKSKNRLKR